MDKYRLVSRHDRAGRLVDASEFENLRFPGDRFQPGLLEELATEASRAVVVDGDQVVLKHVYVERRLAPLDLYVREANPVSARAAIVDYGRAIKNLAAANVFPGDMLLKNFGVTRGGRVVFYDYDEITPLTECNFRGSPSRADPTTRCPPSPGSGWASTTSSPRSSAASSGCVVSCGRRSTTTTATCSRCGSGSRCSSGSDRARPSRSSPTAGAAGSGAAPPRWRRCRRRRRTGVGRRYNAGTLGGAPDGGAPLPEPHEELQTMDQVTLAVEPRHLAGTRPSRRMRRDGRIPAVVYGRGIDPISVSVDKLALYSALRSETGFNTLFTLDVAGDTLLAVAREVQRHPVRNEITHLDFIKVSLDIEIEAEVNLEFVGVPLSVSQDGAVLDTIETSVHLLALPTAIPTSIQLDVSELELGQTLHVSDLPVIEGVTYTADPDHTLVTVLAPRVEEPEAPAEGEEGEEGEAPAEGAEAGAEVSAGDAEDDS